MSAGSYITKYACGHESEVAMLAFPGEIITKTDKRVCRECQGQAGECPACSGPVQELPTGIRIVGICRNCGGYRMKDAPAKWCNCQADNGPTGERYFWTLTNHGWICEECHGLRQTG